MNRNERKHELGQMIAGLSSASPETQQKYRMNAASYFDAIARARERMRVGASLDPADRELFDTEIPVVERLYGDVAQRARSFASSLRAGYVPKAAVRALMTVAREY